MILIAYRHGFRVSELVDLRWDQIDFETANLAVRRAKKGTPSTHPILGDEMRALRRIHREQELKSPFGLYLGAGITLHHSGLRAHSRAGGHGGLLRLQGTPPHAAARLWIRLGQQGP